MLVLLLGIASANVSDPVPLVDQLERTVSTLDATTCEATLDRAWDTLYDVDTSALEPGIVALHPHLDQRLFTLQLQAGERLRQLHTDGRVSEGCVDGFRRLDLALRYAIDRVQRITVHPEPFLGTDELASLDQLQSGDVLVSRGAALSSAGIAHIGAVDSSFSHNAMVYADDAGKVWTVEAYLEKGAVVQPLEDFLAHGVARVAVLRFEDPSLAAAGAERAFLRVRDGEPILYDEAFDGEDHQQLFCSEIVAWSLSLVGGPDDVPLHATRYDHEATPGMYRSLGLYDAGLSAPGDLLVDPRFHVVGEWRDLGRLEELHLQDAVVDGLFRHLAATGLTPRSTWTQRAFVDMGLAVRRTPLLGRLVADQVHPHGDRGFLLGALALQEAGQRLHDQLLEDLGPEPKRISRRALDARIDQVLRDDAEQGGRSGVHHLLRASP